MQLFAAGGDDVKGSAAFFALIMTAAALFFAGFRGVCRSVNAAAPYGNAVILTVSAEEFGADGRDGEDDRTAIQAAMNYARDNATSDSPVTVTLGDGIFYVSDSILIYSHTRLVLSDGAVLSFRDSPEGIILQGGDRTKASYDTLTDVVISGGTWRGNASATGAHTELIGLKSANGVTIDGLRMEDSSDHFIMLTGVRNASVKNCSFSGYVSISPVDQFVKEAVHIDFLPLEDGELFPSKDIAVENCVFDRVASGVGTHNCGGGRFETNISVSDCTFNGLLYNCVNAYSMSGLSVNRCMAYGCGSFLWARESQGTFDANVVSGCGDRCFAMYDGSNVNIVNCVIKDVGENEEKGIAVLASDSSVVLESCSVSGTTGTAVRVKNSGALSLIRGNVISDAGLQGIFASNTGIVIEDNIVSDCQGIWTEASESVIGGNTVNGCLLGVSDHMGTSRITGNTIAMSGDYGIRVTGTEETKGCSVVEGNSIENSLREDVRIGTNCSGCVVRDNCAGMPFRLSYSRWTDVVAYGNGENPPPEAPAVNCTFEDGRPVLSWSRASGADYYIVCGVDKTDGSLSRIHVTRRLQYRPEGFYAYGNHTFLVMSCASDGTPCVYTIPTNAVDVSAEGRAARLRLLSQSGDVSALPGEEVSLSARASGSSLRYSWYFKKPGEIFWTRWNDRGFRFVRAEADSSWDGMQVRCAVADGAGRSLLSEPSEVKVSDSVRITAQSGDVTVAEGRLAYFSAVARGDDLRYSWYVRKSGSLGALPWKGHGSFCEAAVADASWDGAQVYCVISDRAGRQFMTEPVTVSVERNASSIY